MVTMYNVRLSFCIGVISIKTTFFHVVKNINNANFCLEILLNYEYNQKENDN